MGRSEITEIADTILGPIDLASRALEQVSAEINQGYGSAGKTDDDLRDAEQSLRRALVHLHRVKNVRAR